MIANSCVQLRIIDIRQELVNLQSSVVVEELLQEGIEAHLQQLVTKLCLFKIIKFALLARATELDHLLLRAHNLLVLSQIRFRLSLN